MAKIIITIVEEHNKKETYVLNQETISIGRGFNNDIILTDPYVSAEHVIIRKIEDSWSIEDCNSRNGTFFEKHKRIINPSTISSGETFYIGKTCISIYKPDYPVSKAKPFDQSSFLIELLKKTNWISSSFLLLIFVLLFWANEIIDLSEKVAFLKVLIPNISLLFILLFCTGFWTSIGLLVKKKNTFHKQFFVLCSFFIINLLLSYACSYIGFILSSELLNTILFILSGILVFFIVIQLNLKLASNISKKGCYFIAGSLSLMIVLPICIVSFEKYLDFNEIPIYNANLFPPTVKLIIPKTPETFLKGSLTIFK